MTTLKPKRENIVRTLLIAAILLNALVPMTVSAKLSSNENIIVDTLQNENGEDKSEITNLPATVINSQDQRFARPAAQASRVSQQLQSGRTMTLTGITSNRAWAIPVDPPDGITCFQYGPGIRCDFNLIAIADGYWGQWWYREWTVRWDDSEPGDSHSYYGLVAASAPDVYWYHDPYISFFGGDKFSNGASPPVGYGYVTLSESKIWGERIDIQLSIRNEPAGPTATFSGFFVISPDPIGTAPDPYSVLYSAGNSSAGTLGGFGPTESACYVISKCMTRSRRNTTSNLGPYR